MPFSQFLIMLIDLKLCKNFILLTEIRLGVVSDEINPLRVSESHASADQPNW